VGDEAGDEQYRSILHFDTSPLPATAVIVHVDLHVKKQGLTGSDLSALGALVADIQTPEFGNGPAVQAGDFQAAADMLTAGTFAPPDPADWSIAGLDPEAFQYIDLAGTTQFRLRFTLDDNDDNGADYVSFFSGDAGAISRPVLIVYYYTVP
jgi:hypothetical protein